MDLQALTVVEAAIGVRWVELDEGQLEDSLWACDLVGQDVGFWYLHFPTSNNCQ